MNKSNKIVFEKIVLAVTAVFIGVVSIASAGEINGLKWNDSDFNGIMDAGENGVSGITICYNTTGTSACTVTDGSGMYSFTNLDPGDYIVYEILPLGAFQTFPLCRNCTFVGGSGYHYFTLASSEIKSNMNFGNKDLVPPPEDVSVEDEWGSQNGVPVVYRPSLTASNPLTIRKNLSSLSDPIAKVDLTLRWGDGTVMAANMNDIGGSIWEANIPPPLPSGLAQMTFEVYFSPDDSIVDAVQIGDIMFMDPSGQIRDSCTNSPLSNATATLFYSASQSGPFIVSPPENQNPPDNPQITDEDGNYSWLTVSGWYKVKAEKAGYITAESPVVFVPPAVDDLNIDMTPEGGCLAAPLSIQLTQIRLYPHGSGIVQIQGEINLGSTNDGINPAIDGVKIKLFIQGGNQFYSHHVFLEEINDGWVITQSEKDRTGIQDFKIRRTSDPNKFTIKLVDTKTGIADQDYSLIAVDISSGNDAGVVSAELVEKNGKFTL